MPLPPLSLYLHVPWCVRKCPYCDFNSHEARDGIPEEAYVEALLADAAWQAPLAQGRAIGTVFIGGGTPSLLSPEAYERLFAGLRALWPFAADVEITLEANPGTVDEGRFAGFRAVGINRLSIGVQSFDADKLKALGRIHDRDAAIRAAELAHKLGFPTFNLDLMHGLPGQSLAEAMADLDTALALAPPHLSWYQLTIEPNTVFYNRPPVLPADEALWDIQEAGHAKLEAAGLAQYEISAYARPGQRCRHNLNYWQFGDYLAVGAGAHGKVTLPDGAIVRYWQTRLPRDYLAVRPGDAVPGEALLDRLQGNPWSADQQAIAEAERPFEFLMNALRLVDGVATELFPARTGLDPAVLAPALSRLRRDGLLVDEPLRLACTPLGRLHLNTVLGQFL